MPTDSGVWLICNGQSTAAYPKLAEIVGSNVPNYQGIFLRGYGSQMSSHYGNINHTSDNLGILQGDSIRNITGSIILRAGHYNKWTGVFNYQTTGDNGYQGGNYGAFGRVIFDASLSTPVTNEIRPINRAVHWLIKAA